MHQSSHALCYRFSKTGLPPSDIKLFVLQHDGLQKVDVGVQSMCGRCDSVQISGADPHTVSAVEQSLGQSKSDSSADTGNNGNSGWNVKKGQETDTSVLRYDRVAMLEAVLAIRERRQKFVRWIIVALLLLVGAVAIAAGIPGWS